ncbi:MAG: transglycosylase SLT domain-containing protein [Proteobacteria bacterium]|nr:transglycosylase SLT domain-containing protein [Pseudomonadota bacterium]
MNKALILACVTCLGTTTLVAAAVPGGASDAVLGRVDQALTLAEQGQLDAATARQLRGDPLVPWIDYATLHRDLDNVDPATVRAFLERNPGQVAAAMLRDEWLAVLAQRRDWKTFRAFRSDAMSPKLRCADLDARLDAGEPDVRWYDAALALWRSGDAQPSDCDAVFAQLASSGKLTPDVRWQRIDAAADAVDTAVMRAAARGLPEDQEAQAQAYARFIDAPSDAVGGWPRNARSRHIVAIGLAKQARRDPDGAEARLARLQPTLQLGEADRGRAQYAIALWTVASYLPASARRLAAVPASAYDAKLHEWQAREALARGDDATALKAIAAMDPAQRADPRWEYFEARLRERAGQLKAADALYRQAATTATYHGFLAADRLHLPYSICPLEVNAGASERAQIAATPALVRAFELYQIGRNGWAEKEWKAALTGFDDRQRQIAVLLANQIGWYDRATFALGKDASGQTAPDELRLYTLRFPLDHADTVRAQARRNAIDPAWVAAEIRAESAWNPQARSSADARGLMQLLPSVGQHLARTLGMPWGGVASLFDPRTSITLGSAFLRQMLDRYDGRIYLAIGAYNAGGGPVSRWLAQRGSLDPDLWIETVPYQETRDYIMRVLAFSVIYDWRLSGKATPLSERMLGRVVADAQQQRFACALPTTAPAASTSPSSSTAASTATQAASGR